MIRRRIPASDDRVIYQLVVGQLLPYSRKANPGASASFTSVEKRLKENEFTFVAAGGVNQAPHGFVTGKCRDRQLFIDMLALDERNQGLGFGSALMQAAEQYARARGCISAFLFVDEGNPRAQRFYLGKGYNFSGYDQTVHCFRMSKFL